MHSPTPHPDFQRYQAERDFLRERLAALAVEEAHLLQHRRGTLIARYYQALGHLEVESLRLEIESSRTKREIEMIVAAQNRGTDWDYATIQAQLDDEFLSWQEKLKKEQARLAASLERQKHILSASDVVTLTKLYRELVKRLHPDLNPGLHPEKAPLWHRLQQAYANANLDELRLVQLLLGSGAEEPASSSLEMLKEELETLRKRVEALVQRIDAIQNAYPFTWQGLLDDPVRLNALKAELEEKILNFKSRRDAFAKHLQTLLDTPGTP